MALGRVRQLAYVVDDIETAMDHLLNRVGIGPFFFIERVVPTDLVYMGRPSDPILSFGLAQSGDLQIELIQQHNSAPTVFFDGRPPGQHHLAFWTSSFDQVASEHASGGHDVVQELLSAGNRNAFFERDETLGTLVEISEISGEKGDFFRHVAEASEHWNGDRPIRRASAMRVEAVER